MTKARDAVLSALERLGRPTAALAIAEALVGRCDQATVYRALHWLEANGFVEAFEFRCELEGPGRYYAAKGGCHRHWFHCERCHRFVDLGPCALDGVLESLSRERGISIASHYFGASGLCADCRESPPGAKERAPAS